MVVFDSEGGLTYMDVSSLYLAPKHCMVIQHTLDTQHVFFASFHYDNRLFAFYLRRLFSESLVEFDPSKRRYHISYLGRIELGAGA